MAIEKEAGGQPPYLRARGKYGVNRGYKKAHLSLFDQLRMI